MPEPIATPPPTPPPPPEPPTEIIKIKPIEPEEDKSNWTEGLIIGPADRPRIICKTRNSLKDYDKSGLSRIIKTAKGDRLKYWIDMKERLVDGTNPH